MGQSILELHNLAITRQHSPKAAQMHGVALCLPNRCTVVCFFVPGPLAFSTFIAATHAVTSKPQPGFSHSRRNDSEMVLLSWRSAAHGLLRGPLRLFQNLQLCCKWWGRRKTESPVLQGVTGIDTVQSSHLGKHISAGVRTLQLRDLSYV